VRYLCSDSQEWVLKCSIHGFRLVAEMLFGLLAEDVGAVAIPRAALIRDPAGRLCSGSLYIGSPSIPCRSAVDAYVVGDPVNRARVAAAAVLWAWVGSAGGAPHYDGEPPATLCFFYDHEGLSGLLERWAVEPWGQHQHQHHGAPVFNADFTHAVHNWRLRPDELAPFVGRLQAVGDERIAAACGLLPTEWGLPCPPASIWP
jgi:hypothetical protein